TVDLRRQTRPHRRYHRRPPQPPTRRAARRRPGRHLRPGLHPPRRRPRQPRDHHRAPRRPQTPPHPSPETGQPPHRPGTRRQRTRLRRPENLATPDPTTQQPQPGHHPATRPTHADPDPDQPITPRMIKPQADDQPKIITRHPNNKPSAPPHVNPTHQPKQDE